jgi:hypothetical protein
MSPLASPPITDPLADLHLHRRLAHFNADRLLPAGPDAFPGAEGALLVGAQNAFVETARAQVAADAAAAPAGADFAAWFTALRQDGPGQGDRLFPWLAEAAGIGEMRWFLSQEAAGEAGFDDLVAMAQVKMPARAKLEMARNYWDEMGRGREHGMHGRLLERLVRFLDLPVAIATTLAPALALGNLMVALATQRPYAYHAVGALGVIELTAPGRVAQVAAGLKRLGIPAPERLYFDLHAELDHKHAQAWIAEVIAPLVAERPHTARWIAEGALMRLHAGARCFAAYREALAVPESAGSRVG